MGFVIGIMIANIIARKAVAIQYHDEITKGAQHVTVVVIAIVNKTATLRKINVQIGLSLAVLSNECQNSEINGRLQRAATYAKTVITTRIVTIPRNVISNSVIFLSFLLVYKYMCGHIQEKFLDMWPTPVTKTLFRGDILPQSDPSYASFFGL